MKYIILRPAIAMVELIFAIVVMGIAMLSIPLMLETATKSSIVAFQQESIAIIASHANSLMTYAWDENNTQIATRNNLLITAGDNEIDGNSTLNQANQSRSLSLNANASLPSSFGFKQDRRLLEIEAISDDIDDFDNTQANLSIAKDGTQITTEGDYMDIDIIMDTNITYLDDTANYSACIATTGCSFSKDNDDWGNIVGTSNIKLITTMLTSSNVSQKQIVLRSFMCNIGAAQLSTRGGY